LTASNIAACTMAMFRLSTGGLNGAAAAVLRAVAFHSSTVSVGGCAMVGPVELNAPATIAIETTRMQRAIDVRIQHLLNVCGPMTVVEDAGVEADGQWTGADLSVAFQ
jgi:hypothetical protein